jgi:Rieske Fe-S protein
MTETSLSRRRFIKTFALGTAFSSYLGRPWRANVMAETVARAAQQNATFKIRVSDYPPLANQFGSVRLGVNPVRPDAEPFPDGDFWPFLINRGENGEFYVLDSECRHASCVIPAYEESSFGMQCPCHGSTYAIDGSILTGPTEFPLRAYQFEFDGDDTLTIHIPGLGFATTTSLAGPAGSRLRLNFATHYGITYQVHFRARITDPWAIIPFSTTPDGPANETAFFAISLPASLYVDRTTATGFYAVSMLLAEV